LLRLRGPVGAGRRSVPPGRVRGPIIEAAGPPRQSSLAVHARVNSSPPAGSGERPERLASGPACLTPGIRHPFEFASPSHYNTRETTMSSVLELKDVRKSFKLGFIPKTKEILKGITFSVAEGEIFGYLGPNGAGKTTTIKCALGLIFPDSGTIELFGRPHLDPQAKERLGFLPENPYFYDYLTAAEFLDFYAQLFKVDKEVRAERIPRLLKLVGMERAGGLSLRKFSRGMLQRVGLAQALINDPALVILDEPLGGLDPLGRKEIRDIILRLRDEGKTVLFTSHILQDIEMICHRVAIIVGGRILSQGQLSDLVSEKILFTEITVSGLPAADLAPLGESVSAQGGRMLFKIFDESKVGEILELARTRGAKVHALVPRTQTLEDIFVDMVKPK
jgi:ABC-2 type transport system ATP-binding protein